MTTILLHPTAYRAATDEQLVDLVRAGDDRAFAAMHNRYRPRLVAFARQMLGGAHHDAEEVVQDAFLLVWKRADSFDVGRGGSLRAWLLAIVRHRAIDVRRRYARHDAAKLPLDGVEAFLAGPDVWDDVLAGLDRDQIRAAVAALPDEQRRAIELAYFDGLTHGAIAEHVGAPLGTVKGRLRLGLRKLHGSLLAMKAP